MESWKAISGKPGYMVSSEGRVSSPTRGILHQTQCRDGYRRVSIGNQKFMVHRLVAAAFVPNPDNLPQVNHIDEVRNHNLARNLQWVSAHENLCYGHHSQNVLIGHRLTDSAKAKKGVLQHTLDGHFVSAYGSINEASRHTGTTSGHIAAAAKGTRKSAGGFRWSYIEDIAE